MRVENEKRGIYTQNMLYGIDLRASQGKGRASKMRNLLSNGGTLRKRNGFTDVAHIQDWEANPLPIYGIYSFGQFNVLHAGDKLIKCPKGFEASDSRLSSFDTVISDISLQKQKTDAAVQGNKLWILSERELLTYDGSKISRVYDSPLAHIPTTRKNIKARLQGAGYDEGESENLLCSKRKNTLIGTKEINSFYELDGKIDTGKGFLLKCSMDIDINDSETKTAYMGYTKPLAVDSSYIESIIGAPYPSEIYKMFDGEDVNFSYASLYEVNVIFKQPIRVSELAIYAVDGCIIPKIKLSRGAQTVYECTEESTASVKDYTNALEGKIIDGFTIYGSESDARIARISMFGSAGYQGEVELSYEIDKVIFERPYTPSLITTPSGVELELYTNYEGTFLAPTAVAISDTLAGTGLTVMFSAPSLIRNEANIQIEYAVAGAQKPEINMIKECKTDTGKQILALHLGNNTLAFTDAEHGFGYVPSIYRVQLGNSEEITAICQMQDFSIGVYKRDSSYYIKLSEKGVHFDGAMENIGCIGRDCALTINKDTVVLSGQGIYGAQGQSAQGFSLRSGPINSALIAENLENAFFVGYDGRMYLFLDSVCYVGDTRFKSYHSQDLDDGFEYEWFMLDNMNASCAGVIDGRLYIGTQDGKIRTLNGEFCDIEYRRLNRGEIAPDTQGEISKFYFDPSLGVGRGTLIGISGGYKLLCDIQSAQQDGSYLTVNVSENELFDSYGYARIYENMNVYLDNGIGIAAAKILSVDYSALCLRAKIEGDVSENPFVRILLPASGDYTLMPIEGSAGYYMLDDRALQLHYAENVKYYTVKKSPVRAEYISAPLNLDLPGRAKTLHRIALDLLPTKKTELTVGYEAVDASFVKKQGRDMRFDLDSLDFASLSFYESTAQSLVIRCYERGLDTLKLRLCSDSDSDLAIQGYSLVFTHSGLLKGERI